MISANLGMALALGLSAMGGGHDHRAPAPGTCDDCGIRTAPVLREIQVLRTARKEDDREDAAEDLRKLDWRCHPEAVLALCDALLLDRSDDVREEAAESLGRMAPGVPAAHEALGRAAATDPDGGVRKEARKALGLLGRRCVVECAACGGIPAGPAIVGSPIIPDDWMPYLAPAWAPATRPVPPPSTVFPAGPEPQLEALPPAPPARRTLSDTPPPPPVPVAPLEGPVGARVAPSGRRVR